jgi:hypothetical protein
MLAARSFVAPSTSVFRGLRGFGSTSSGLSHSLCRPNAASRIWRDTRASSSARSATRAPGRISRLGTPCPVSAPLQVRLFDGLSHRSVILSRDRQVLIGLASRNGRKNAQTTLAVPALVMRPATSAGPARIGRELRWNCATPNHTSSKTTARSKYWGSMRGTDTRPGCRSRYFDPLDLRLRDRERVGTPAPCDPADCHLGGQEPGRRAPAVRAALWVRRPTP